jgi:FMN phosphatase YigB (HAD superfamily)
MMATTKRVLLLDYDGVVLRNNVANSLVSKRAGLYTRNVISIKNNFMVDTKASSDLCFNLYKGYGHTLSGLNAVGINQPSVSLKNYNNFVYSCIDYEELQLTNNDMNDVKQVVDFCQKKNINLYMFSNSPKYWIHQTLGKEKELTRYIIDIRDVLNIRDDDATMLKPKPAIYDLIDEMFRDTNIVFLDDSACNFQSTLTRPNWTNVLYCQVNCKPSKNMQMINELHKIEEILESY